MSISGKCHFVSIVKADAGGGVVGPQHDAVEALAAVDRSDDLGAGGVPGEAVPVLHPGQRAVDTGGADFQAPGAGNRVFYVHHGIEVMAEVLAVVDRERGAVRAVHHDLHRGPVAAEHGDAYQLVAHMDEGGLDDGGDPGFQADVVWFALAQNKKGGP